MTLQKITIGFLIVLMGGCSVQESAITGQKRMYAYTWQQEVQIGNEADGEITAYFGLLDDPEVNAYVTSIGERVLEESHMRREGASSEYLNTPFTFRVLSSPVVNAFALPGGFNYVTRGLLTHMTSEAQLAMVIGHEIGHVAARHASQQALSQQAGSLLLIGGAVFGQELLGVPAQNIMELGGTAAQLLFLRYSRDAERESDKLGVEYSALSGYDASQGAAFFTTLKRLSEASGSSIPAFMSSHPDPGDREQDIINKSERWKTEGYPQNVIKKEEFYNKLAGLVIGVNPREGFVKNNTFYHPELAFSFDVPNGWNLINEPSQVVLVAGDQKAVTIFNIVNADNINQAIDQIANDESVTTINRNNITVNGLSVINLKAMMTQEEQNYTFDVTVIENQNRIYQFLSYTLTSTFDNYSSAFSQASRSYKTVSDRSILDIQPAKIRIVKTDREVVFQDLLPETMPMGITAEDMAILNQVYLDDRIPAGTLLKLF